MLKEIIKKIGLDESSKKDVINAYKYIKKIKNIKATYTEDEFTPDEIITDSKFDYKIYFNDSSYNKPAYNIEY